MKLRKEYVTQSFRGEHLMVATGAEIKRFHGLVRANETAAFIIERLKSETDEAAITVALIKEYDVDELTAEADVHRIVELLGSIGAIEE